MSSTLWESEVPERWGTVPLKHLMKSKTGGTPDRSKEEFWNGEIPWVSSKDMKKEEIGDAEDYVTQKAVDNSSTKIVPEDTLLVVARSGILNHTIPVAVTTNPVAINQDIRAYIPRNENIDPRYIRDVIAGFEDSLLKLWRQQGATVQSLDSVAMSETAFPVPPQNEQQRILTYCADRAGKIKEAIRKSSETLDSLKERRKAVIREAVLGGVIESPTSPSDVGWIGRVPEHWDVVRTRFVAELHSGHTPSKSNDEYWEDGDIPWVSLADSDRIRHNDHISETEKYTNEKGLANSSAHILPKGTVVFTRDATVGLCSIMERPMAVSQHIVGWVCGPRILPEYLLNVLKSMDQEYDRLTRGSTISTIGMHDIEGFKTPLPPLEEQREIVDHIETETGRLWELIDRVEETIDLLEEKRQALITAAVTGQIDVSDVKNEAKASHT